MSLFSHSAYDEHELVHFVRDVDSGLRGIIAVHSSALGPGAGGCRMWNYASEDAALQDVLRLSRGMSYKNAMANLPLGGGKAVILGDARQDKSEALFEAFGRAVNGLAGQYVTAEDVGVCEADMQIVARHTRYVSGLPQNGDAAGGDPSPKTALGVFCGIQAAVSASLRRQGLDGLRVAVQGLGNVGRHLCALLHEAGARLWVADIDDEAVAQVCQRFDATPVAVDEILYQDVDVLAPCALGGVLHSDSIPRLQARIVAGAANNQLLRDADGQRLFERGILYAPDYVINAGGIISCSAEYIGGLSAAEVDARVADIGPRLAEIFQRSQREKHPPNEIADALARDKLGRSS